MSPSIDEMVERAYGQLKEGCCEEAVEAFSDCLLLEPAEARAYYGLTHLLAVQEGSSNDPAMIYKAEQELY